jgi:ankyrin repeat protein
MWAARNRHESVVKLLVEKGADIEVKDKYGQTLLSVATGKGKEYMVKLLQSRFE